MCWQSRIYCITHTNSTGRKSHKKIQIKVFFDDYEHVEGDHEDAEDADVVHLLPAVRRQVEGEHCEEGDAHAGDD